jgi:hypothetical protein
MTRGQHVISVFVLSYILMTLKAMDIVNWSLAFCTAPIWGAFLVAVVKGVYEELRKVK